MKRSIRKYMRICLAGLLTLVMIAQTFAGLKSNALAADTGYTELKFGDWGTYVKTVTVDNIERDVYSLTDASIPSLDNVAISGTVNFNGTNGMWLTIGGTDDVAHGGFWFGSVGTNHWRIACQGIGTNYGAAEIWNEACFFNTETELRITFDKDESEDTWEVNTYSGDVCVSTLTYADVTPGLYISIPKDITVDMTPSAEPTPTYKEMKFGDWGTYVKTVTVDNIERDVYSLTDASIPSLDNVAISGTVNFNGTSGKILTIGGTDNVAHGGFWFGSVGTNHWRISCQGIGTNYGAAEIWNEACSFNTSTELRITFDKDESEDTWEVNTYSGGVCVSTLTYADVTPGLYISIPKDITVDMTPSEESTPTYKEMKFTDWSEYKRTEADIIDIYTLPEEKALQSLDGVAVSGMLNFNEDAWKYISIGGGDDDLAGIRMLMLTAGNLGMSGPVEDNYTAFDNDHSRINTPFYVRMTFDYDVTNAAWVINVYADGTHLGTKTYENVTLGTHLAIYNTITMYDDMTFEDWGIQNGARYEYAETYSLTEPDKLTALDKIAVKGIMNFNGNNTSFRIGGANYSNRHTGFQVGNVYGYGLAIVPQGVTGATVSVQTILGTAEWANLNTQDIELCMVFDKKSDSVYNISVFVDGSLKGTYDFGAAEPGLYMANNGVSIYGAGGPDIYNPPTEMAGKTLSGTYITNVAEQGDTTVISSADEDNQYVCATDYSGYGLDFVMDYDVDRDIKILQLTDTQIIDSDQCREAERLGAREQSAWHPNQMYNLLFRYILKTVRDAKPDLILLTGDNIYGEFDDDGTSTLALIHFMDSLKIPWAPIFGNHDNESEMGVQWQCEQFAQSPYCLFNRRNEIGGNGNYSIGIAKNGKLERVIYMMDNNGCYNSGVLNGNEVKTTFGFTDAQKQWYQTTAESVNNVAGKTIPSFLAYHAPTKEMLNAVVSAGYQTEDSTDTYTLGIDITEIQEGDSGTKGQGSIYTYEEDNLLNIMQTVGTDGAFFGHQHLNSLSVLYENIRWTFGLKTGTYDQSPEVVGGTLITLESETNEFAVTQVQVDTSTIGNIYPSLLYTLPEVPENPNYIYCNLAEKPDGYQVTVDDVTIGSVTYSNGDYYKTPGVPMLTYIDNGEEIRKRLIIYTVGDTTLDDEVDVKDIVRIKKYIAKSQLPNQAGKKAADFDDDHYVTDNDAALLRSELVKKK